ncbi:MAG: class I SAM-dependent methyltransferase, partial [Thermodesulfobacteriota bacterium]|nr:class I SAM-dependent methyltransferase [Thermodesulfobacteriota bacterium]
ITINEQAIAGRLRFTPASQPASFEINKIEISEHTLPWLEDKNDLTETNKRLFGLPPYAQDHKNLFSMVNYASLYLPILNILRPECICEIGSDAGDNTKLLAEYCAQNGAQLLIVDPVKPALDFLDSANHVRFSLMKSTDFLRNNHSPANVFFIDGDHNYQTVSQELQLIDNMKQQTDVPFCLFVHDISWPCAYRDMYYDPDELGVAQSCYCRGKGISPYSECPVDDSQLPASHAFATTEGGPANGVKKAIEDFLAQRDTEWRNIDIASLYGFGVLWTSDRLSPEQYEVFDKLEKHFSYFRDFLAILEWNRMVLYYQIFRNSEIWEKQQDHIKKQQDHIKKLEHWIDRGVKERISDFIKAKTFKNNIDITQRNRQ